MLEWKARERPALPSVAGRFVRVDAFSPDADADDLFGSIGGPHNDDLWHYIPLAPPATADALRKVLTLVAEAQDWQTHVFRHAESRQVLGMASYMRIRPEAGSAEVGCVIFSKALQRTPAATEAMFLMAQHLFDELGYRRYEWKCDNDNSASRRAAARFGFTAEGVFRQDLVVKGRNRDTAWFSMLDREWPRIRTAFERWLAPENFAADGRQREALVRIREGLA